MQVREIMTSGAACVHRSESLSSAARLMWDRDCGAIPVIEDETGQVVGMITDRDICMATWSRNQAPSEIGVVDAMSQRLHFCGPDDSVEAAEKLMRSNQIRRVPVLDDERKLVGILSLADIVTCAQRAGADGSPARELSPAEISATLANICQPKPGEVLASTN